MQSTSHTNPARMQTIGHMAPYLAKVAIPFMSCLVWGLWLWLFRPTISWLTTTLGHESYRLNVLIACSILVLGGKQLWDDRERLTKRINKQTWVPMPRTFPLALVLVSVLAYLPLERYWDIDILSATFFGIGSYALLGCWLSPERCRRGWPVAWLLILALPFGTHMDQLLGFPARVLSAQASQGLLSFLRIASISTQSILILENGISHVDLPCSGMKSLWSGSLFFLALTWMRNHRLNLRWFLAGVGFVVVLLVANILRVTALTLLAVFAQQHDIANIVHTPLGMMGFLLAGAFAYIALAPPNRDTSAPHISSRHASLYTSLVLLACLSTGLFGAKQLYRPRPLPPQTQKWSISLPVAISHRRLPLSPAERDLFRRHGHAKAHKIAFQHGQRKGTLLLVYSTSWRAHHPPEICLAASGYLVTNIHSQRISGTPVPVTVRKLQLNRKFQGYYWYQSRKRGTDILMKRILGSLRHNETRWVMASVIFQETKTKQPSHNGVFLTQLIQSIDTSLKSRKQR